jgi:hypothetical protein
MTKFDLSQIKPIPGFYPQKWLRKVRTQINEVTKDMTSEEVCEYFRKSSEEFRTEIECRRAELAEENRT